MTLELFKCSDLALPSVCAVKRLSSLSLCTSRDIFTRAFLFSPYCSLLPSKFKLSHIQMGTVEIDPNSEDEFSSTINPLDHEEFRKQGHMIIDYLADYYQNVKTFSVRSKVDPGYPKSRLPDSAPYQPESIEKILQDLQKDIIQGLTHWQSPNYFALFPCSLSTASFLGEALSTGFGTVGFNWISSPAATELENIVMDWFGKMLKLPSPFLFSGGGGGVLQGTICEAMLSILVAARDRMLRKIGRENIGKLVVYVPDQTHFSLQKSAQISGINPSNIRVILTTKETNFAISPHQLCSAIVKDLDDSEQQRWISKNNDLYFLNLIGQKCPCEYVT